MATPFSAFELRDTGKTYGTYGLFVGGEYDRVLCLDTPITPKENFKRFMSHRKDYEWVPDPMSDYFTITPEVNPDNHAMGMEGGLDSFGVEWEALENGLPALVRPGNPKLKDIADWRELKAESLPDLFDGEHTVWPISGFWERPPFDQAGRDWFGCRWDLSGGSFAPAPSVDEHLLEEIGDWREVVTFPDLEAWDWEKAVEIDRLASIDREHNLVNLMLLNGLFERMHVLMGFENALCALLTDEEEVGQFLDALTDFKIKLIDKIAAYYKPDVISYHDDWGTQKGPFFSPELWRRLFKKRTEKIIRAAHDRGILFVLHSCGKFEELIPEIVEIGVDTLQCMDIMDVGEIIRIADGRMSVQASVHTQQFEAMDEAGILTEEYVRKTVHREFTEWGKTGYYMPSVMPSGKWYDDVVTQEYLEVSRQMAL